MNKALTHKFQNEIKMTYEKYFRDLYVREIGLEKELERVIGLEKAHELLRKWGERSGYQATRKEMEEKGNPIQSFEDFKEYWKDILSMPFWSNTLTSVTVEETENRWIIKTTECLWAKTFQRFNETELGYILCCHPDFEIFKAINPKLKMKRTKTLMQGANCCDFAYCWDES